MSEEKQLTIFDHLGELRVRLVRIVAGILIGAFASFHFAEHIFAIIRLPIAPYLPNGLIYTGPIDKFMAYVKIAVASGIVLSCPYWFYQIWAFVAPGLYKKEKKIAGIFVATGSGLFVLGILFSYFVALPMAFKFLMTFGGDADKPMIAIDSYLDFVTQISLMFGLSFELPLVISLLGMLGLVSKAFLKEKRRYAVMIIAVVSAIVTPPDLLSMVLMMGPMVLLYEISIPIVGMFERKRAAEQNF